MFQNRKHLFFDTFHARGLNIGCLVSYLIRSKQFLLSACNEPLIAARFNLPPNRVDRCTTPAGGYGREGSWPCKWCINAGQTGEAPLMPLTSHICAP